MYSRISNNSLKDVHRSTWANFLDTLSFVVRLVVYIYCKRSKAVKWYRTIIIWLSEKRFIPKMCLKSEFLRCINLWICSIQPAKRQKCNAFYLYTDRKGITNRNGSYDNDLRNYQSTRMLSVREPTLLITILLQYRPWAQMVGYTKS